MAQKKKKEEKKNYKVYKYNIEMIYEYQGKPVKFKFQQMPIISAYRDFINHNRPMMYVQLRVDKRMLDDMVKNVKSKYVTFIMEKIAIDIKDIDNVEKIKTLPRIEVFKDQFLYITPSSEINTKEETEYGGDNKDRKDMWTNVIIGLMHPKTISNNETTVLNTYYKKTKATDAILHRCEKVSKLVLEPIHNNVIVDNVPSCNTISDFLWTLYCKYAFYKTPYRLFFDYKYSYIISNSGNLVKRKGEQIYTAIFKVHSNEDVHSKIKGMETNYKKKHYFIDIDAIDIEPLEEKLVENRITDITRSAVRGLEPYTHSNKEKVDVIFIVKEGLDTNEFSINKEYFIDNYHKLDNKRGIFILVAKKDIYSRDGEFYKVNTVFTMKFVKMA